MLEEEDLLVDKGEVTVGVMVWVGDQHQVGRVYFFLNQPADREVCPNISIHGDKRPLTEQPARMMYSAAAVQ